MTDHKKSAGEILWEFTAPERDLWQKVKDEITRLQLKAINQMQEFYGLKEGKDNEQRSYAKGRDPAIHAGLWLDNTDGSDPPDRLHKAGHKGQ